MSDTQKSDPIRDLLADLPSAMFLGNPTGTVAIWQSKVVDAGGDPDEVEAWVRANGGQFEKSFPVNQRRGLSPRQSGKGKNYYVVPEAALR